MKKLLQTIQWDVQLQIRYHILTVAVLVTAGYVIIFLNLSFQGVDQVVDLLIFSDPSMLGFMFIGVLMLVEKGAGTLHVVVVTPLQAWQYIWSKAISLTLIALPCSIIMAIAGHGWEIHFGLLILGVIYASLIFVLCGFIGVSQVKTLNQYLIIVPLIMTPLILPLLNFFGLTDSLLLYLIPSQAPLILFEAVTNPVSNLKMLYAYMYPLPWIWLLYRQARKCFLQHIAK